MEKIKRNRGMHSTVTEGWQNGFPIGNGTISGVLYEDQDQIKMTINGERLFVPWSGINTVPDLTDTTEKARSMILAGQEWKAAAFFAETARERGLVSPDPDNPRGHPDCFQPACQLVIRSEGDRERGVLSLDFSTGETVLKNGSLTIRSFALFSKPVLAVLIEPGSAPAFTAGLEPVPPISPLTASKPLSFRMKERYVAGETVRIQGRTMTLTGQYTTGGSWQCAAEFVGNVRALSPGTFASHETLMILLHFGEPHIQVLQGQPEDAYTALLEENLPHYREAFGSASLELCGGGGDEDNETLLEAARHGTVDPALLERVFDMGAYLCASSSGDLPPHAMGRWVPAFDSHGFGDYVFDMEVEECLWPACDRGMKRSMDSLEKLIARNSDDWRLNAERFYGARGFLVSCRTTNRGLMTHLTEAFPLSFWTACAAWLAFMLYDRYLHSMDLNYLKETALPFMEEAVLFYYDTLRRDDKGEWVFCPSYSPENVPGNYMSPDVVGWSMATINAAMDIFCVKELADDICEAREKLGKEPMPEAQAVLSRLPRYMIQEDGTLCEWAYLRYKDHPEHRHMSHLVCAYPFLQTEDDPVLFEGARKAIRKRLETNLGNEGCGWSWGHVLNIGARLKDREIVKTAVQTILTKYEFGNLMTKLWEKKRPHEEYAIQQIDAACALSSGLIEALVCSRPGHISLLPAWPFQSGTVRGICLRGHVFLKEMTWDSERIIAILEGDQDTDVEVGFPEGYIPEIAVVRLKDNKAICLQAEYGQRT